MELEDERVDGRPGCDVAPVLRLLQSGGITVSEMGFWRAASGVEHHRQHELMHEQGVPHMHDPDQMSAAEIIVELRNENIRLVEAIRATLTVGNFAYRMQQALDSIAEAQVPEVLREFRSEYGRIEGPAC